MADEQEDDHEDQLPTSEEIRDWSAKHFASLTDEELVELYAKQRHPNGRFMAGRPSPNPAGRRGRPKPPRSVTKDQAVADVLELMEQPVTIRKGRSKQTVPAIRAIYDQLIHKAVTGDWNAIKLCIALREKYSQHREDIIVKLYDDILEIRTSYELRKKPMPDDTRRVVELVERRISHLLVNAQLHEEIGKPLPQVYEIGLAQAGHKNEAEAP